MKEVTWAEITAANASIDTMEIVRRNKRTGAVTKKDYAEVNQRVKAFRMVYPTGLILTEMVSNDNGVCVFRATVAYYNERGEAVTIATGTAFEAQDASDINRTSYIENCETSAVGRALGFCGFGIDTSICSAEELTNALEQQERNQPVSAVKVYPTEILGAPIVEAKEMPVPADTAEDAQYRILCMRKVKLDKLNKACMNKFQTDFRHTPVAQVKEYLPEEILNSMDDLTQEA